MTVEVNTIQAVAMAAKGIHKEVFASGKPGIPSLRRRRIHNSDPGFEDTTTTLSLLNLRTNVLALSAVTIPRIVASIEVR